MLLPSVSHEEVEADQLAPSHLLSTAPLRWCVISNSPRKSNTDLTNRGFQ